MLATVSSATGALSLCQVGPGFAQSHYYAGPAAQAPPSAGPSRKHSCRVVRRRSTFEPLDVAIITTPERQLLSDCRPVTQLGLLVRSHALLELMQMTAASFVRVECLLQCLQNQARLARLQAGNGAPRKRPYLANRADDKGYAQQSGALTVIAQSAGGEPSCAPRLPSVSRALSSPAQCSVSARPWTPLHL